MDDKIQLLHPQGKKAVNISRSKYELIKPILIKCMQANAEINFTGMCHFVAADLKKQKLKFEGSVNWYVEWVKLDLEARKILKRIPRTSPQLYSR